ncbi:glycoside hydrolase family 15 protein [Xylona heveae TC161]|uniref:glucan 1,4-alpha-glucosidase n=1 Tax=Xylona heveae (strain CBS 132557 / TC161) TaxID=1328760 RepID=A0A165HA48_XYLHT|nr:glycoside hydrolase family 15 protein [Xylona heveae TC161]KZF23199.1 glycoside hydrolase family 15 protein [Xylona heveae TC161]
MRGLLHGAVLLECLLVGAVDASPVSWYPWVSNGQQQTLAQEKTQQHDSAATILKDATLDAWLEKEETTALSGLLANVAPGGVNTIGAAPGTVIASPSKSHPNYYFQWVRDAAITTSTLVDVYASNATSPLAEKISSFLADYAHLQVRLQRTPNPSGNFSSLSSLGEPKFMVDGTPFTGSWGRPQRDGPALRALTLMRYLRAYNQTHPALWTSADGGGSWFKELYEASMPALSIIKADLEYVSHHWRDSGFDLWEEVNGLHFFTAMVQRHALLEGAQLAALFDDPGAADWYARQAEEMRHEFLPSFWDEDKGHLVSTLDTLRSGLDCAIPLGAIHGSSLSSFSSFSSPSSADADTFPATADGIDSIFAPFSDEVLVSTYDLIIDQRHRFPINAAAALSPDPLAGVGIGRYPEDVYNGDGTSVGNPWFLCTASVAELFYRTAVHAQSQGWLQVSPAALRFWNAVNPAITQAVNISSSPLSSPLSFSSSPSSASSKPLENSMTDDDDNNGALFNHTLHRLRDVADNFLAVVKHHADAQGSLSEQFDGFTGYERGARDLTWSYGALVEAVKWRRRAYRGV